MTTLKRMQCLPAASADKAELHSCTSLGKKERALPIVGALLSSKASAVKRISREDLPTPESPTKSTCAQDAREIKGPRQDCAVSHTLVLMCKVCTGPTDDAQKQQAGDLLQWQLEGSCVLTFSR